MDYGQDIEIRILNLSCHGSIERQGRGLWSPRDLSYLISTTASLLQRFPSKFSDKIPLGIKNHNSGVGHHNLSLQYKQLIIYYQLTELEKHHPQSYTDAHHVLQVQLLAHFPPYFPGENVRKPLGLL